MFFFFFKGRERVNLTCTLTFIKVSSTEKFKAKFKVFFLKPVTKMGLEWHNHHPDYYKSGFREEKKLPTFLLFFNKITHILIPNGYRGICILLFTSVIQSNHLIY